MCLFYTDPRKHWSLLEYANARNSYQYDLEHDTPILFFDTKVQEDAFFGHLLSKNFHIQKTVDFGYMCELVPKFDSVSLKAFLEHKCD